MLRKTYSFQEDLGCPSCMATTVPILGLAFLDYLDDLFPGRGCAGFRAAEGAETFPGLWIACSCRANLISTYCSSFGRVISLNPLSHRSRSGHSLFDILVSEIRRIMCVFARAFENVWVQCGRRRCSRERSVENCGSIDQKNGACYARICSLLTGIRRFICRIRTSWLEGSSCWART